MSTPDYGLSDSQTGLERRSDEAEIRPSGLPTARSHLLMWWRDLWRFLRRNVLALTGVFVIYASVVVSLTAPVMAPCDPLKQDLPNRLKPPSLQHPMGTDGLGRDILSRVMHGGRISLPIAVIIVLVSMVIGMTFGSVAGFFGGVWDSLLMRFTDLIKGFLPMILAMVIAAALCPGLRSSAIAVIIVWWPTYARLLRGLVLSVKQNEYVLAAEAIGAHPGRILFRTVLPNCLGPVVVLATLDIGSAILTFAALSFLGLGPTSPMPEWGLMVGKGILFFDQWWVSGFPGLAIFCMALAFNFVGDGLQDALDSRLWRGLWSVRNKPSYTYAIYPGGWLNGAFIGLNKGPILIVPRTVADLAGPHPRAGHARVARSGGSDRAGALGANELGLTGKKIAVKTVPGPASCGAVVGSSVNRLWMRWAGLFVLLIVGSLILSACACPPATSAPTEAPIDQ